MNELVDYTVKEFFTARSEVKIDTIYQEGLWHVNIDRVMIGRALQRLYQDVCRRMSKESDMRVQTANALLDDNFVQPFGRRPGAYVKVSVQIQDIFSDENNKQRTFEPFYTDKESSEVGLGMASVFGIVKKHDGITTVDSESKGTSFNIFLPAETSDD